MYVLVTYRDEENQMKNEGARVVTTLYSYILDAQGQLTVAGENMCGFCFLFLLLYVPSQQLWSWRDGQFA